MLGTYTDLHAKRAKISTDLQQVRQLFGRNVLARYIYENTGRVEAVSQLIDGREADNVSLLTVTVGSKTYNVIFARLTRVICGEYKTIEDFQSADVSHILDKMEIVQSLIVKNAMALYSQLPKYIMKSCPEYKRLIYSNRNRFLYYYRGHETESFRLIFTEK